MKKKILALSMAFSLLTASLTGCGVESSLVINNDLSATQSSTLYLTEAEVAQYAAVSGVTVDQMKSGLTVTTAANGQTYYASPNQGQLDATETKKSFKRLDSKCAILSANEVTDSDDASVGGDMIEFNTLRITYPYTVVETNGVLEADGKTVYYDSNVVSTATNLYAYFDTSVKSGKKITVKTAKKNGGYTVQINTDGVIKSVNVKKGSKKYTFDVSSIEVASGVIHNNYDKYFLDKEGTYTFTIKLESGAKKTQKVYVDNTAPTTNVKSGKSYKKGYKLTFKDKISGMKSAKLDGKTVKSGAKVNKKGKHTLVLKDKQGNTKTVKFTIK